MFKTPKPMRSKTLRKEYDIIIPYWIMESSQKIPIQQKKVNLQQWLHNFLLSFETRPYSRETSIPFMLEIEAEIPKRAFITITTYLTGQSMRFLRLLFDNLDRWMLFTYQLFSRSLETSGSDLCPLTTSGDSLDV